MICISESWLQEYNTSSCNLVGYSAFHLCRSNRFHGGVSVFISNQLNANKIDKLSYINEEIEILSVQILINQQKYTICSLYRPRSKHLHVERFTEEISKFLGIICCTFHVFFIKFSDKKYNPSSESLKRENPCNIKF